jgi:sterol desaturase/sphingolipid hydroxylase (fatty acid hydroxylase superfamily)
MLLVQVRLFEQFISLISSATLQKPRPVLALWQAQLQRNPSSLMKKILSVLDFSDTTTKMNRRFILPVTQYLALQCFFLLLTFSITRYWTAKGSHQPRDPDEIRQVHHSFKHDTAMKRMRAKSSTYSDTTKLEFPMPGTLS